MDFDTDIWQEINDMPGEIFDIPEMQDVVVDFEKALNSDKDDSWYTDPMSKASYHHY